MLGFGTFLLWMLASFVAGALSLLVWQRRRSRRAADKQ